MTRRQFFLSWKVPCPGHEWIDAPLVDGDQVAEEPSRLLTVKQTDEPAEYDYYHPLRRETALFRVLANLPVEETAIREFADRYGLLADRDCGLAKGGRPAIKVLHGGKKISVRSGDIWELWINQILSLKTCLHLWQKAQAGDRPYLKSVIVVVPNAWQLPSWLSALVRFSETGVLLPSKDYFVNPLHAKIMPRIRGKHVPLGEPVGFSMPMGGEIQPPASFYVGQRIGFPVATETGNAKLWGGFGVTYPADSIDPKDPIALAQALVTSEIMRNLSAGLAPIIMPHAGLAWGELCFVPGTLREAIWLQFAEAICGDKTYRECQVCGKPFELSPDVARTNKLFCGDSCKMQAYRQRKAKSADLWAQGCSLPQIGEILGSDLPQVTKWIVQHLAAQELSVKEIAGQLGLSVTDVRKFMQTKNGRK